MTDRDADALGHLDCLLLRHAGQAWLAPASLVAEVLPHFSGVLPDSVSWRGLELACLADSHPARALVVMRRVLDGGTDFYTLATSAPPRALSLDARSLVEDGAHGLMVSGERCRLFDAAQFEARLTAT